MNARNEQLEADAPELDINLIAGIDPNSIGVFFGALALAQGGFAAIEKNRAVTIKPKEKAAYSFRYADMQEIRDKTTPALSANGFALVQLVTNKPKRDGGVHIRTVLGHSSGARMESILDIPRGREGEIKDFGAYITYLRRYVVSAMLNVAADDDLDEQDDQGDNYSRGTTDGFNPRPGPLNPAPGSPAEHPLLTAAVSVGALTRQFNQFSPENKEKFTAHYERRLDELEPRGPVTEGPPPAERGDDL